MNKRKLGNEKETMACDYLQEHGFVILERNFWCQNGEIDIIAKDDDTLVFVEVKYRKNSACGGVDYSVLQKKQKKICECALVYLMKKAILVDSPMRFDVLLIEGCKITHHQNAFEVSGSFI